MLPGCLSANDVAVDSRCAARQAGGGAEPTMWSLSETLTALRAVARRTYRSARALIRGSGSDGAGRPDRLRPCPRTGASPAPPARAPAGGRHLARADHVRSDPTTAPDPKRHSAATGLRPSCRRCRNRTSTPWSHRAAAVKPSSDAVMCHSTLLMAASQAVALPHGARHCCAGVRGRLPGRPSRPTSRPFHDGGSWPALLAGSHLPRSPERAESREPRSNRRLISCAPRQPDGAHVPTCSPAGALSTA